MLLTHLFWHDRPTDLLFLLGKKCQYYLYQAENSSGNRWSDVTFYDIYKSSYEGKKQACTDNTEIEGED